ncbi:lysylphosphatidylglycerol synthase domain-containing protein [Spirillospora sp. NPDC052269]
MTRAEVPAGVGVGVAAGTDIDIDEWRRSGVRTAALWMWPWCLLFATAAACAVAAVAADAPYADDDVLDLLGGWGRDALGGLDGVPWAVVPLLVFLTVTHYACTGKALRSASGRPLPKGETFAVQIAAAAASRLVPAGIGSLAVLSRYLNRRGHSGAEAVAVVGLTRLAGGVSSLSLFFALGAGHMPNPSALGSQLRHVRVPEGTAAGLAVAMLGATTATYVVRRRSTPDGRLARLRGRVRRAVADAVHQATELRHRPRACAALLLATLGTPLALGTAFTVSVIASPGGPGFRHAGTLLLVYLVGSAAGTAVPLPAGTGANEAALIGTLVAAGVAGTAAVQGVLLFRAVTFWAPVPFGLLAARRLRRIGAL